MRLRRRYHSGGGIPAHPHPHTEDLDLELLQSLVPAPLKTDVTRVDIPGLQQSGIQLLEDPVEPLEKEYEDLVQSIMSGKLEDPFVNPLSSFNLTEEKKNPYGYNTGTFYSRSEAEDIANQIGSAKYEWNAANMATGAIQPMEGLNDPIFGIALGGAPAVRSAVGAGLNWLYKPMLRKIPGLGGVTGHHILSALGLHHMVTETPKSIQEFIDNPSPGQALHVTWDALMGVPGMIELKKGIPASIKAFQEGKRLARFKRGGSGEGPFLWDDATMNWRKMSQAEIDWLAAAEGRNPKLIGALTEPADAGTASSKVIGKVPDEFGGSDVLRLPEGNQQGALQQLIGGTQAALPAAETTSTLQQLAKDYQKGRDVRTKKGGYVAEESPYLESNVAKTGSSTDAGDFDPVPGVVLDIENPGVYQYSGFIKGGPLEKLVRAKDGSIAISDIEKYVNNLPKRSINEKNAILEAIDDTRQLKQNPNFDSNKPVDPNTNPEYLPVDRVDYETFRSYLSSTVQPAEVVMSKESAHYGVERLGYQADRVGDISPDVVANTYVYKDPELGLGPRHGGIEEGSYWVRVFDDIENPDVRMITEVQTSNPALKGSTALKENINNIELLFKKGPTWYDQVDKIRSEGLKNQLKINNANTANLPVKQLNEIFLQAARDGKDFVTFPTVETSMKIQNHNMGDVVKKDAQIMSQGRLKNDKGVYYNFDYKNLEVRNKLFEVNKNGKYELPTEDFGLIRLALRPDIQKLLGVTPESSLADKWIGSKYDHGPLKGVQLPSELVEEGMYNEALSIIDAMYKNADMRQHIVGQPLHPDFLTSDAFKSISEESQKALTEVHNKLFNILDYDVKSFPQYYRNIHSRYPEFMSKYKNEFNMDFENTVDRNGNTVYKVGIPDKFYYNNELNPAEIKTYKKGGILQSMAKKYFKKGGNVALRALMKKYGAGGSVENFGSQGNFTTEYTSKQPEVIEIPDPNLMPQENSEDAMLEGKIEIDPLADLNGDGEITEEEKKKYKNKKKGKSALSGAASGAMVGATFGPWGAVIGGVVGGAAGWLTGKNGMKIKKRSYDDGGLFEALRDRRAKRRIERTPIKTESSANVLQALADVDKKGAFSEGYYSPSDKEITMRSSPGSKSYDEIKKHEDTHATQHSPLLSLFYGEPTLRVQDPDVRRSTRKLLRSIKKWERKNPGESFFGDIPAKPKDDPKAFAAAYMLGLTPEDAEFQGGTHEYEAIVNASKDTASNLGIDFNKPFDEVLSNLESLGTDEELKGQGIVNLRHLRNFMRSANYSDKQKELIMKSLR